VQDLTVYLIEINSSPAVADALLSTLVTDMVSSSIPQYYCIDLQQVLSFNTVLSKERTVIARRLHDNVHTQVLDWSCYC
jgi:hypothetical protein